MRGELPAFLVSSVLLQGSRLAVAMIAAGLLGPAAFGVWTIVLTLLAYSTHGALGLLSGANQQIPLALGAGRPADADAFERAAFGGTLAAAVAIGVVAAAGFTAAGEPWRGLAAPIAAAVAAQQLNLFSQISLRARLAFAEASRQQAALAIVLPALSLPLLVAAGVAGLALGQAAASAVVAIAAWRRWRPTLRPTLDPERARSLLGTGFPIMVNGLAFAAMTSVDRWAIAAIAGPEVLGRYGLAALLASSLVFVTLVVAQQAYPRLAHAVGAGVGPDGLWSLAVRQGLTGVAVAGPAAAALVAGSLVVIPAALPAYVDGLPAMAILALGFVVLGFGIGFANLLVTLGRAWWMVAIQVAVTIGSSLAAALALTAGGGLSAVAAVMAGAFAAYTALAGAAGRRALRAAA